MNQRRRDFGIAGLLVAVLVLTRWPLRMRELYEWDAVQHALGALDFDVVWHQPHPPGYLAYVLLARWTSALTNGLPEALLLLNLGLGVATMGFIYALAMEMAGRRVAVLAGLLLLVDPLWWFYGEVSAIYAAEGFVASAVAWMAWRAQSRGGPWIGVLGLGLGLLGGMRQSTTILLLPLVLLAVLRHSRESRRAAPLLAGIVLWGLGTAAWYIPTAELSGGAERLATAGDMITGRPADKLQLWFGSISSYYALNLSNLSVWLLHLLGPLGLLALPLCLRRALHNGGKAALLGPRAAFLLVGTLPPLAFYALAFIDKPGYLLCVLPFVIVAMALGTLQLVDGRRWRPVAPVLVHGALCALWFLWPAQDGVRAQRLPFPEDLLARPPRSDFTWDLSIRELAHARGSVDDVVALLDTSPSGDPGMTRTNTVILARGMRPSWRQLHWELPDVLLLWPVDDEDAGEIGFGAEVYRAHKGAVSSLSGEPFWFPADRPEVAEVVLPPDTEFLLWVTPKHAEFTKTLTSSGHLDGTVLLPSTGRSLGWTQVQGPESLQIGAFRFASETSPGLAE